MSYSLPELTKAMQVATGAAGRSSGLAPDNPERVALKHDAAVATLAYRVGKLVDAFEVPFTDEDAEHICAVLASRVEVKR